jgi:xanthine dehydrogenase YagS FAD-binding subunit
MRPFKYTPSVDTKGAVKALAGNQHSKFLAGGTNILDLMKEDVERPNELIDISRLKLTLVKQITAGADAGGVSIGALGKNSDTANHPLIRQHYPLLSQAILAGASAQIRNMASNGGNLLQRTRCSYFYDVAMPCNKREPGTGCSAMEGINRMHAIFGWSEKCIAVYPSDMSVALAAYEAKISVQNISGKERSIPFADFHRLPGETPEKDNNLEHGELITSITLPKNNFAAHSYYLKVRDRASYAFALISVGAALQIKDNTIINARIAMGGVAHKPWRAFEAEKLLNGRKVTEDNFREAAEVEMKNARPLEHNNFKVELGKRGLARALQMASGMNKSN